LQILACLLQRLDGLFDSADAEQMIAKQKLQVSVEAVELGPFGEAVNLVKKDIVIGIETARIKDALLFRQNFCQSCPKKLGSFRIFLIGEKGLRVGERKYHIIRCKVDCSGEHAGSRVILAGFEGLDSTFEVGVDEGFRVGYFGGLPGKLFANVCKGSVVNDTICCLVGLKGGSTTVGVVIVGVVVVRIALHFTCDRIVAVPIVRVVAIPVIAEIAVPYRPVAAQTNENVSAVIVRINIPEREARPPSVIVHRKTIPGPDYSVA